MSWLITGTEKYETDPYRSQVSLLLHGDGTNGSTTIVDSSPSTKTVTAVGNAQISTAQSKFGGASLAFDGTGDYLQAPSSQAFNYGTENFTIECWAYPNTGGANTFTGVVGGADDAVFTNTAAAVIFYNQSSQAFTGRRSSRQLNSGSSTVSATAGQWHHLALVRSSGILILYVNGVAGASVANADGVIDCLNPVIGAYFGDNPTRAGLNFNGYIDDLRITKGIARYTANFTPPTAPFPDI